MAKHQGHFVWYELMSTDPKASEAFYSSVVGWSARAFEGGNLGARGQHVRADRAGLRTVAGDDIARRRAARTGRERIRIVACDRKFVAQRVRLGSIFVPHNSPYSAGAMWPRVDPVRPTIPPSVTITEIVNSNEESPRSRQRKNHENAQMASRTKCGDTIVGRM